MMNSIQVLRRTRWVLLLVGISFIAAACNNQTPQSGGSAADTAIRASEDPALVEQNTLFNQRKEMFIAETARLQALEAQKNSAKADLLEQKAAEDNLEGTKFTQTETTKRAQIAADADIEVAETENSFMKSILGQGPMGALGQYFQADARKTEAEARLKQSEAQNLLANENMKRRLQIDAANAENESILTRANASKILAEAKKLSNSNKPGSYDETIDSVHQSNIALQNRSIEDIKRIQDMDAALTRYESSQKDGKAPDRTNLTADAEKYLNGLIESAPTTDKESKAFIKEARSDLSQAKEQLVDSASRMKTHNEIASQNMGAIKSDSSIELDWRTDTNALRKDATGAINDVDAVANHYFGQDARPLAGDRGVYGDSAKPAGLADEDKMQVMGILARKSAGQEPNEAEKAILEQAAKNNPEAFADLLKQSLPPDSAPLAGKTPPPVGAPTTDQDPAKETAVPEKDKPKEQAAPAAGTQASPKPGETSPAPAADATTTTPAAPAPAASTGGAPSGGKYFKGTDGKVYQYKGNFFGKPIFAEVVDPTEAQNALALLEQEAAAAGNVTTPTTITSTDTPNLLLTADGKLIFNSNGSNLAKGIGTSFLTADQMAVIQKSLKEVNATADLLKGVQITDLADYKAKAKEALTKRFDAFESGLKGIRNLKDDDQKSVTALVNKRADLLEAAKAQIDSASDAAALTKLLNEGNFATPEKANVKKVVSTQTSSATPGGSALALNWQNAPIEVAKALSPKPLLPTCSQFDSECSQDFGTAVVVNSGRSSGSGVGGGGETCDPLTNPGACT